MPERKRRPRRSVQSREKRGNPALPTPTRQVFTWRGRDVVPQMLLDVWREADRALRNRTKRIEESRAFRRKDAKTLVRVDRQWARLNPEAAALARLTLPQRTTLERDLIARVGSADTVYTREPLGFNEGDVEAAEQCAAYLNEWKLRAVPSKVFAGKSVEDSEFGRVTLPCDLDLDASPDYFEYIADAAYDDLPEDERRAYGRDDDDRRRRYVKRDADGERAVRERYRPRPLSDDEERLDADAKNHIRDKRAEEAERRHQDDVTQYILRKQLDADATRVIPALDCRPIMKRGTRRDRWVLVGLIERVLYESWDLLAADYAWDHLGDRAMTPRAARDDGGSVAASDVGQNGQFYLYRFYTTIRDDDGHDRPMIFSCVGGAGTWDAGGPNDGSPKDVHAIDLYDQYKVEGPLWSYHFGSHTEDDDPDHYGQPYMWALMDLLKGLETEVGAARAVALLNSLTGHVHTPDPNMPDEATLESDGALRVPEVPKPGQIVSAAGQVTPFQQAQLGTDLWRMVDHDRAVLAETTAIDSVPGGSGPSGHALLVAQTLGTIAKRQNRECVLEADVACAEAHLRILCGIHEKWGIKWPIRTTQERPVKGEPRTASAPAVFDPAWVRDGQFNVAAEWPNEANLAMVDLLAALADRGYSNFDAVQHALGEQDANTERKKVLKDAYFKHPLVQMQGIEKIAQAIGNVELIRTIKALRDQGEITPGGVPGAKNGVPTAALPSGGRPPAGSGGPSIGASVRGGVEGAQQRGAQMQQDAATALQNGSLQGAA